MRPIIWLVAFLAVCASKLEAQKPDKFYPFWNQPLNIGQAAAIYARNVKEVSAPDKSRLNLTCEEMVQGMNKAFSHVHFEFCADLVDYIKTKLVVVDCPLGRDIRFSRVKNGEVDIQGWVRKCYPGERLLVDTTNSRAILSLKCGNITPDLFVKTAFAELPLANMAKKVTEMNAKFKTAIDSARRDSLSSAKTSADSTVEAPKADSVEKPAPKPTALPTAPSALPPKIVDASHVTKLYYEITPKREGHGFRKAMGWGIGLGVIACAADMIVEKRPYCINLKLTRVR